MNTTIRTYETLYIVDPTFTDEQVESTIQKFSKVVTDQGGEVIAAGKWDKRRLTYEIRGRREGIYILMYFKAGSDVPKELDRVFRISDEIYRHIILVIDPKHIDTSRFERAAAEEQAAQAAQVEEQAAPEEEAPEAPAEEQAVEAGSEGEGAAEETSEAQAEAAAEEK